MTTCIGTLKDSTVQSALITSYIPFVRGSFYSILQRGQYTRFPHRITAHTRGCSTVKNKGHLTVRLKYEMFQLEV